MNAEKAFKELSDRINLSYYISKESVAAIEEACLNSNSKPAKATPVKKAK